MFHVIIEDVNRRWHMLDFTEMSNLLPLLALFTDAVKADPNSQQCTVEASHIEMRVVSNNAAENDKL